MKNQMKNLVMTVAMTIVMTSIVIVLPTISMARSVDRTPVVASVEGNKNGIVAAYLLADGRLQVKPEVGTVATVVLSKAATSHLIELAITVADAKLTEQTSAAVCMMVPPPSLGDLSVSGFDDEERTFTSVRKLVLTNSDCTVSHRVTPSNRLVAEAARELRAALVALTLNTVQNTVQ